MGPVTGPLQILAKDPRPSPQLESPPPAWVLEKGFFWDEAVSRAGGPEIANSFRRRCRVLD